MTISYRPALTIARWTCVVCGMRSGLITVVTIAILAPIAGGCRQQWFIDSADREVATLIATRQNAAIGFTTGAHIGNEDGNIGSDRGMYQFVPSPIDADVPQEFKQATIGSDPADQSAPTDDSNSKRHSGERWNPEIGTADFQEPLQESSESISRQPFGLSDCMAYAIRHSREYQSEKEILYLTALDLTLERFLWTPRFVESVLSIGYDNAGQAADWDQAFSAVSRFAVEQRLPFGGEVTARVIHSLIRSVSDNVTTGESGQVILETRLPLLRGAGRVAYESRYQSERELIYAIRAFERFRRRFLVDVASDYFTLLSDKAQIDSAESQAEILAKDYAKAQALADAERTLAIESDRARVSLLNAQNAAVNARERYETNLDAFKIRIGMPTIQPIDIVEEEMDLQDPDVAEGAAIETALKYRLDLLNTRDRIDDARRGVLVAKNNLLPQIDLRGGATLDTDPEHLNTTGFNTDRTGWFAGVDVEIPLNRQLERNDYRSSLIRLRRTERQYDEAKDTVRLEVRRAIRRLAQTKASIEIQAQNIPINEFRAAMARTKYDLGELNSNRDVVEAEDDLRSARNDFAEAQSQFRRAVVEFLRDTGTLRVEDNGLWMRDSVTPPAADDP